VLIRRKVVFVIPFFIFLRVSQRGE